MNAQAALRIRCMVSAFTRGVVGLALTACTVQNTQPIVQPEIGVRSKTVLTVVGHQFRDANGNGQLDPYEDWRLPTEARVSDLLRRMTLQEKVGMMLIDTLNAGCEGSTAGTQAADYVQKQKMTRFILRNVANATTTDACTVRPGRSGYTVTPRQLAEFTNSVQAMAEAEALGIPVQFKDNARNHYNNDPRFGISSRAGAFTEFPREAGIAAAALGTGDMTPVQKLTEVMGEEWRAVGLRGAYAYMADLATDPRWYRVSETFSENADLSAEIMRTLVLGLQRGPVSSTSAVALTMKHFPGAGAQDQGLDPHYSFGKFHVYPGNRFDDHLKRFIAAVDAGVSAIMPYYGVPNSVTYKGVTYRQLGFAFNRQIVTDLLRGTLGFQGYVNSDTGIITDRAWGLEDKTVAERVATAVNAGVDVLSGFSNNQTIVDLVSAALVSEARVTEAARRLLSEQFNLNLFENPYVDPSVAEAVVGSESNRAKGLEVQKQSVVLLQNADQGGNTKMLPLAAGRRLYTMGMGRADVEKYGYGVTDGNYSPAGMRPSAGGHDAAVIRVQVNNISTDSYRSNGPTTGADPAKLNPRTGNVWGAEDPCILSLSLNPTCVDDGQIAPNVFAGLIFGGALPWEANNISFSTMAASKSWQITPSLADIKAVMNEVGAHKTVLAIYFRQPYVIDTASGLKNAGAILATFGVSDSALLEVLSGKFPPQGKLPFALASHLEAVTNNQPDVPGYAAADTLYAYRFGLTY